MPVSLRYNPFTAPRPAVILRPTPVPQPKPSSAKPSTSVASPNSMPPATVYPGTSTSMSGELTFPEATTKPMNFDANETPKRSPKSWSKKSVVAVATEPPAPPMLVRLDGTLAAARPLAMLQIGTRSANVAVGGHVGSGWTVKSVGFDGIVLQRGKGPTQRTLAVGEEITL